MIAKPLLATIVAVPLLAAVVVSGRNMTRCCHCDEGSVAVADDFDDDFVENCCLDDSDSDKPEKQTVQNGEPSKQFVFKVESLRCPAVKGIGCGHMLRPMLKSLDKIEGVQACSANYTGTMIRVAVLDPATKTKVEDLVREALAKNKPTALSGDALTSALNNDQWREAWRVGELSAIEFRAITLYRVNAFATAEKLDKDAARKLTKMAEELWDRLAQDAKKEKAAIKPQEWLDRCKAAAPTFLAESKKLLSDEQVERLKDSLTTQCRGDDRPEAPPPPTKEKKVGEPNRPTVG